MEYNSAEFRKWLDKLQQESWQLELIISGFAIFGLFTAIEPLEMKAELAAANSYLSYAFGWWIVLVALYILLFNLLLHVLLRGLWIGAIGLRYVSGDINYENLKYSQKFSTYLKRKVGSFDRFIAKLENYCSVLFAVSFLLVFYVLGAILCLAIFTMFSSFITKILGNSPKWILFSALVFNVIFLLAAVVVFIDFLGQGFLKKKKWTSILYFPIYKVFGWLTLSFLYRPLIYNFLDNRFGKRLSLLLVPIYIAIVILSSLEYRNSNFLKLNGKSTEYYSSVEHYEDFALDQETFIKLASIPSKVIESQYLKVFLIYEESMEDFIFEKNKTLKPLDDRRGIESSITVNFKRGMDEAAGKVDSLDFKSYLLTINELYKIEIDQESFKTDFIISINQKKRLGFETYLNIQNLSEGRHTLSILGPGKENPLDEKGPTIEKTLVTIPFWYFPEKTSNIQNLEKVDEVSNMEN